MVVSTGGFIHMSLIAKFFQPYGMVFLQGYFCLMSSDLNDSMDQVYRWQIPGERAYFRVAKGPFWEVTFKPCTSQS